MVRAGLAYLAAVDAAQLPDATLAECLQKLERADAIGTAVRASFLSAFTIGKGYSVDADYSARAWLMHQTGITRGAAASHTAWARRAATHPRVVAALATEDLSESYGRTICQWTDKLPADCREAADAILLSAAKAGMGLRDVAGLAAEMHEGPALARPIRTRHAGFADRGVRPETRSGGGVRPETGAPEAPR